jgi:hypothetical protein
LSSGFFATRTPSGSEARLPGLRRRCGQHALPLGQRPPSPHALDDLHHQQPPAASGRILHDQDLAQATVDRVFERRRLLTLDGPSMRTPHLGLDEVTSPASNQDPDNVAGVCGIARPEFPEPAIAKLACTEHPRDLSPPPRPSRRPHSRHPGALQACLGQEHRPKGPRVRRDVSAHRRPRSEPGGQEGPMTSKSHQRDDSPAVNSGDRRGPSASWYVPSER